MRTLKLTILAISLAFSFMGMAQNYFVDGTIWNFEVWGTHEPIPHPATEQVYLSKSPTLEFLEMYHKWDASSDDAHFVAYVKTEDNNVYFKLNSDESSDWFLFYNFNLKEGEGCYVYSPDYLNADGTPYRSFIKCTRLSETPKGTEMLLQQYDDETCQDIPYDGVWLKGIGSLSGVLDNNKYGMMGRGSKLVKVVSGDEIIYSTSQSAGISSNPSPPLIDIGIDGHNLFLSSDYITNVFLYTQNGICINKLVLDSTPIAIKELNPGVYILSAEGVSKKIIIY